MTTNEVIMVVAAVAIFSGLVLIRAHRPRGTPIERKPPPRRDLDA
jgi:hypothetical protein